MITTLTVSDDEIEVVCDSFESSSTSSSSSLKRSYKEVAFPTESNCGRKRIAIEKRLIPYSTSSPLDLQEDGKDGKKRYEEDGLFPEKVETKIHRLTYRKTFVTFAHVGGTYRPYREDYKGKLLTNFQLSKEELESQLKPKKPEKIEKKSSNKSPFIKICKRLKLLVDPSNLAKQDVISKYFPKVKLPDNFVYIMSNERKNNKQSKKHQDHCHCTNGCLPKYCINYMSQIECPTDCNCGDNCQNRVFTKMAYPELICFQSESKGIGVKCNQDVIKKGSFITEYVGEVISVDKFEKRTKRSYKKSLHHYCMNMNENEIIDATWMGNIARFINHSCSPNARTQTWVVNGQDRVGIFAIKDIFEGEEITYNYNFLIYNDETKQQVCKCGAQNCQGVIGTRIVEGEESESDSSSGLSDMLSNSEDEEYDSDDIYMQYIDSD